MRAIVIHPFHINDPHFSLQHWTKVPRPLRRKNEVVAIRMKHQKQHTTMLCEIIYDDRTWFGSRIASDGVWGFVPVHVAETLRRPLLHHEKTLPCKRNALCGTPSTLNSLL